MNISIFLQNRPHFGTTIIHVPLIYSLQSYYPQANIFLFSKNESTNMLTEILNIKNVFVNTNRFVEIYQYTKINSDITISLRKNSSFLSLMISLLNRKEKYGLNNKITSLFFTKTSQYQDIQYRACNFLNLLPKKIPKQYFTLPKKNHLTIIPAGEYLFKHWKIENYLELADMLHVRYPEYHIFFLLGQREKKYIPIINNHSSTYKTYLSLDLPSLINIIQSSQLVIANDCGPAHIAQISDVANLILYSNQKSSAIATAGEWFRKKANSSYIIGENLKSIDSISVKEVYALAIKSLTNNFTHNIYQGHI